LFYLINYYLVLLIPVSIISFADNQHFSTFLYLSLCFLHHHHHYFNLY